ncbi:putative ribokinase [Ascoidea rubescens DSM 1968]|uniref:Ribokinase-like protein n=1 Tax=Ascoidea rubescens DSM 1968 TaxID=1344418 RepID=A0A1D2V9U5_9ASCO|nr:Ribokinase-like protein [Ascoidea rubescens DSM 1968]ODV58349.1 Ribokinase-like protein [Ascoidea rubescens DSM 1968]
MGLKTGTKTETCITVIGSLNYDLVTYTSVFPKVGETIESNDFEPHIGGKGLNESISISKLLTKSDDGKDNYGNENVSLRLIGCVADDTFGKEILGYLKTFNLNYEYVKIFKNNNVKGDEIIKYKTPVAVILVEDNIGENRILFYPGTNNYLKFDNEYLNELFLNGNGKSKKNLIVIQNEIPDFINVINWADSNRKNEDYENGYNNYQVCYNPSPFKEINDLKFWKKIDLLIMNEIESINLFNLIITIDSNLSEDHKQELINQFNQNEANGNDKLKLCDYKKLSNFLFDYINNSEGSLSCLIVTLGSVGSIINFIDNEKKQLFLKSMSLAREKIVDTTGAGDTFFGAIISQITLNENFQNNKKLNTSDYKKLARSIGKHARSRRSSKPSWLGRLCSIQNFRTRRIDECPLHHLRQSYSGTISLQR